MARDDITVKAVDQLTGVLNLVENEELISHIVAINSTDPEKKFQVCFLCEHIIVLERNAMR